MAVTLNKANLVLKDANGNIGKIEQLSSNDLAKIKTAVSDVALVVNQSNHTPIKATANTLGVVKPDGSTITINSNGVLTATAKMPGVATTTKVGVVKPDGRTITIDSNGTLTAKSADSATKATQDSAGQQINTTYVKGVTASNATITVTKGNGTTSTATINNVENATTATNATNLGGYPASKYVRSVNGVNADKNGNVAISDVYDKNNVSIRFTNGLQFCFFSTNGNNPDISFPLPFSKNPIVLCSGSGNAHSWGSTNISTTGFTIICNTAAINQYFNFLAIGFWK